MGANLSEQETDRRYESIASKGAARVAPARLGLSNLRIGWMSLALGAASGIILGLWSFGGPAPVPEWLGEYGELSRRLARLGHIAFFGLGILNILLARELSKLTLSAPCLAIASAAMNVGNVLMPLILFLAAAWHPLKYLLPIPASAVSVALTLVVWGVLQRSKEGDNAGA